MLMYRSRSDFDAEVQLFVRQLEYKWPRKLVDAYVVAVHEDSAAADTDSDVDQLRILQVNTIQVHHTGTTYRYIVLAPSDFFS